MNALQAGAVMFYAIPIIAILDWLVFSKYAICNKCGSPQQKIGNFTQTKIGVF